MFLAISHLMQSPLSRRIPLLTLISTLAALLAGCGGSGSKTSTTLLQGDPAFRSASVASYQSLGAGVAYPYFALQIASPTGSPLHTRAAERLGIAAASLTSASHSGGRTASTRAAGLTLVPALNLYVDAGTSSGNAFSLNYFTDSAGTQSAGSVTITLPAGTPTLSTYASYPVQIPIAVNITGGNLPCHGNAVLKFTGASGANSLVGDFTLTKNNVPFHVDLALSDQLDVSGAITIQGSGATITATNIRGNLLTPLQCDVTVAPYGWTGTGTLSLTTGQITLHLNTGAGVSTTTADSSGNLTLAYADGKTETVNNALLAGLVSGSTGGGSANGGGSGNGSGSYVGLPQDFFSKQINNAGQVLGDISSNGSQGAFLASATAQEVKLQTPTGSGARSADAMNNSGQIVGVDEQPLFWNNATSVPTVLKSTGYSNILLRGITDQGQILGISSHPLMGLYWANASSAPVALQMPTQDSVQSVEFAVSASGQIAGVVNAQYLYWQSPTAQPVALAPLPAGETPGRFLINTQSQIVTTSSAGHVFFWASPSAQPIQLPSLANGTTVSMHASWLNNKGLIVGRADASDRSGRAVYWKAGQVADMNTLLPVGQTFTLYDAFSVNDQGQVNCSINGTVPGGFGDVIVTVK